MSLLIEEMVAALKEQKDDDSKEEYYDKSLNQTVERKKGPGAVCLSPILVEALEAGIKVLGEAVSEATEKNVLEDMKDECERLRRSIGES